MSLTGSTQKMCLNAVVRHMHTFRVYVRMCHTCVHANAYRATVLFVLYCCMYVRMYCCVFSVGGGIGWKPDAQVFLHCQRRPVPHAGCDWWVLRTRGDEGLQWKVPPTQPVAILWCFGVPSWGWQCCAGREMPTSKSCCSASVLAVLSSTLALTNLEWLPVSCCSCHITSMVVMVINSIRN